MDYQPLFYPQSIAVIGASRKTTTVGNDIVKNLTTQGYDGIIYPINPRAKAMYGHKVYASTTEIKEKIDLIIVCVPASAVAQVISQAAEHNQTKAAVVISAGCKEIGNQALETTVKNTCDKHDIALIGPNCLGVINPEIKMNSSFATLMPDFGNVAFISQSGALCTSVLDYAKHLQIGFSKFISIGNKAQTDELDLLEYLHQDDKTQVIAMYVEQLHNAAEFIYQAKKITQGKNAKPIIVLKSGRTEAGASAVASHTGSLATSDASYEALFAQSGIIRARTIRELLEYVDIFSKNRVTQINRLTILTNAGGPGVLTTDEVVDHGLQLTQLDNSTLEKLNKFLPEAASINNPVDILGDAQAERYSRTLEVLSQDKHTDAVLTLLTPQSTTQPDATAEAVINFKLNSDKPIVASFMGQDSVHSAVVKMESAGVSTTAFPELAARGLAALGQFSRWSKTKLGETMHFSDVDSSKALDFFSQAKQQNQHSFPEAEAVKLLDAYGITTLKSQVVQTVDEAVNVVKAINKPVVLKIVSRDILHKSDVGGVVLNVTKTDVKRQFQAMLATVKSHKPKAKISGVLIAEMAPAEGIETIVGVKKDPVLGHLLMFGLGGIYVEVLKDVQFGFAPLTQADAYRMIDRLQSRALLSGIRGGKPSDLAAIVQVLGRLSQLVGDFPQIEELDINPLLVLPETQGAICLDARLTTQPKA